MLGDVNHRLMYCRNCKDNVEYTENCSLQHSYCEDCVRANLPFAVICFWRPLPDQDDRGDRTVLRFGSFGKAFEEGRLTSCLQGALNLTIESYDRSMVHASWHSYNSHWINHSDIAKQYISEES